MRGAADSLQYLNNDTDRSSQQRQQSWPAAPRLSHSPVLVPWNCLVSMLVPWNCLVSVLVPWNCLVKPTWSFVVRVFARPMKPALSCVMSVLVQWNEHEHVLCPPSQCMVVLTAVYLLHWKNKNNGSGHFCSAVTHWQRCAQRTLEDYHKYTHTHTRARARANIRNYWGGWWREQKEGDRIWDKIKIKASVTRGWNGYRNNTIILYSLGPSTFPFLWLFYFILFFI